MNYHKLLYAVLFALGWGIFTTLLVIIVNFGGKNNEKLKKEKSKIRLWWKEP